MVATRRAHTNGYSPEIPPLVSLSLQWAASTPPVTPSQDTLQYQQVGLAQDLMRSLLFPVFLVCPRPCVHPPRAEFLFALVCGFPVSRLCWPSKPGALGLLPRPALHIGEPHVGLRTFTPVGELLWYNYFPVCGLPTQGYGIWFYHDFPSPTPLLWLLLCLWM